MFSRTSKQSWIHCLQDGWHEPPFTITPFTVKTVLQSPWSSATTVYYSTLVILFLINLSYSLLFFFFLFASLLTLFCFRLVSLATLKRASGTSNWTASPNPRWGQWLGIKPINRGYGNLSLFWDLIPQLQCGNPRINTKYCLRSTPAQPSKKATSRQTTLKGWEENKKQNKNLKNLNPIPDLPELFPASPDLG